MQGFTEMEKARASCPLYLSFCLVSLLMHLKIVCKGRRDNRAGRALALYIPNWVQVPAPHMVPE